MTAHADELSDLKAQLKALSSKVSALEAKQSAAPAAAPAAPAARAAAVLTNQEGNPYPADAPGGVALYSGSDSELRMYGIIEATVSQASNQAGGKTATGFQTAWFSGNRLGFDANHALPGLGAKWGMPDLKVISKLEAEFEVATGAMDTANVLFNRDSWVGLYGSKLGKITVGRQNTLTRDFTNNWADPYSAAETSLKEGGYSNVNNHKHFIYYSGGPGGKTRYDSALEWKKQWSENWITGLAYKFGSTGPGGASIVNSGGAPGDFTKGSAQAASVAYNRLPLVAGAVANFNVSYNRANVDDLIHKAILVGGNVVLNPQLRYNLGYANYKAEQGLHNAAGTRSDNSWSTSIKYMATQAVEFDLGYNIMKGTHAGFSASNVTLNPFASTASVTTTADGSRAAVYAALLYHVDKQLDFYLAGDKFKMKDGWAGKDGIGGGTYKNDGTTTVAVGGRYKF